jgi:hypothetical protein
MVQGFGPRWYQGQFVSIAFFLQNLSLDMSATHDGADDCIYIQDIEIFLQNVTTQPMGGGGVQNNYK